jgi:hypothetical protein
MPGNNQMSGRGHRNELGQASSIIPSYRDSQHFKRTSSDHARPPDREPTSRLPFFLSKFNERRKQRQNNNDGNDNVDVLLNVWNHRAEKYPVKSSS